MKTVKNIIVIILSLCYCTPAFAQSNLSKIDSLAQALYQRNELLGNVLIAQNGQIQYSKSFGYSDVAAKRLNDGQSAFNLASVSKTFTSLAILQLKDKGKLKFDDPAVKFLPDLPYPNITIRHLLSHTSGLTDFQIFEAPHRADTNKIFSNADVITAIKGYKGLSFQPGEKWGYSNTGYALLALIVERISGLPFQDYLYRNIFKPAGMNQTYLASQWIKVTDANKVQNYDPVSYSPNTLRNTDSLKRYRIPLVILGGIVGPGNMVSTTEDLLKFDQALYGTKLVKPATLEEAFQPVKLNNGKLAETGWKNTRANYGLGWMILLDKTNGRVVFHSGGMIGAVSIFLRNTDKKQTVILLDNATHRGLHQEGVNFMNVLNNGKVSGDKKSIASFYAEKLIKKGADYAAAQYHVFKTDTANFHSNELDFNALGLEMLYDGKYVEALEILKMNCLIYPESFNVYDSYGSALAKIGKTEEAIMMYQKSVDINPKNQEGIDALKRLKGQ